MTSLLRSIGMGMIFITLSTGPDAHAERFQFKGEELATRLSVGYAVRVLDMNQDSKPDIVIVDSKRFLWLENPSWTEHVIFTEDNASFDNVCFAPHDVDGDGRVDFAVGRDWQFNNTRDGGVIGWLQQPEKGDGVWRFRQVATEPTTHRMQWCNIDDDPAPELVVAPLKGRDTTAPDFGENGVRLMAYDIPPDPVNEPWPARVLNDQLHVMHNFWPGDFDDDGKPDILAASFEGVSLLRRVDEAKWHATFLGAGEQQTAPNRGSSEIKSGRLSSGQKYIATIEPWHGHEVVVYLPPEEGTPPGEFWKRHMIDDDLKWGHAVACANLDDDDDEELIIGVRDHKDNTWRSGLRIYDPLDEGAKWKRVIVDPGGVNIEDLDVADLDGDGHLDIVAVGRQSHKVKIYWNRP
ncbi:MAG: VCBS repeat-containing protein [Planctomycetales bacterium]|nr:VCBS repeat-containing protein [Planctomycetales bacterium]